YLMMQDMAHKDGLTGINNRMYFMQLFDDAVKKAKRKKSSLSVALYDIDKFKTVNDTYGHLAGDAVIKTVASIGNKYAEDNGGFVGRYGGEEFLIVLPDKSEKEAFPILEAMHEEIKNTTVRHEDSVINVNVCIGLTSYPNICAEPSMLINRADMAMYYGKEHGRGRLVIDDPELIKE
ncbi:MAG: GGDEF domain-containing protein, partial [Lachnospiraceae bacterium]|nr:GGDEF domain-containing protein [Lachnospiraceae bacterium]